jgi:hypothetical protein
MTRWFINHRRLVLQLVGTILAFGLIFVLVREEGWDEVFKALRLISLGHLAEALALVLVSRLFVAARWYVLLRSGDVKISMTDSTALTFTGLFSNNFLPTTVGGDGVRLAGAMQLGYDRAVCLASLVADRLMGMVGMLFTLPFGLLPALHSLGTGASQSLAWSGLMARGLNFARRTLQTFSIWFGKPGALIAALGCTWGHMFCTFLTMHILIDSLGYHVDFWLIAGLWSLAYFVTLVPISINGYGVQELSLSFLFSTVAGLSAAASLSVAVLIRALYVGVSLVGALFMPATLASLGKSGSAGA